jgi:ABC-2 type transport system ATP-binding protein/lipopolysaccharide transport system ATP-binding protein
MEQAEQEGRAVVFVSHDLDSLNRLCTRALWLEAGQVRRDGEPDEVTREYLSSSATSPDAGFAVVRAGPVTVHEVGVVPLGRQAGGALLRQDTLRVRVEFELSDPVPDFDLAIYVTTHRGVRVLDEALSDREPVRLLPGRYVAEMDVPPVLNVGDFSVGLWCGTTTAGFLDDSAIAAFTLHGVDHGRPARIVVLGLPIEITPT